MTHVGVLALQGAFRRHIDALEMCGVAASEIRHPDQLSGLDAIVIPGGESTTMCMMLDRNELTEPLGKALHEGLPAFGTCAGLILLAADVTDGRPDQWTFERLDVSVQRNGYGRQISSFEADLGIDGIDGVDTFRAVFIRAPRVIRAGDDIEVLARVDSDPVLVRTGPVWASAFHPELTGDIALHKAFLATL